MSRFLDMGSLGEREYWRVVGAKVRSWMAFGSSSEAEVAGHGFLGGILQPRALSTLGRALRSQGDLLKLYSRSPAFRRLISRVANSCCTARWTVTALRGKRERSLARELAGALDPWQKAEIFRKARNNGDLVEVDDHPLLEMIQAGSPLLVGYLNDLVTEICLLVVGECFWALEANSAGVPYRSWLIPPHWVRETPTTGNPFFSVSHGGVYFRIPEESMLWFRDPDPYDPYGRGVGFGTSLADEIETDEDAAKATRMFFRGGMRPDILITGPNLDATKRENIRRDWVDRLQGLYKKWMMHLVDAPKGAQVHKLSQDFDGQGITTLRKTEAELMRQALGINPEIVGEVTGSNRATSYMARKNYRENVIAPRLAYRQAVYQHVLVPMYNSPRPLVVGWELPPLEDSEQQVQYAEIAPWAVSLAQHLERQGLEAPEGFESLYAIPTKMNITNLTEMLGKSQARAVEEAFLKQEVAENRK